MQVSPHRRRFYYALRLASAEGVGPCTVSLLLERFGDYEDIFAAGPEQFSDLPRGPAVYEALHDKRLPDLVRERLGHIRAAGLEVIVRGEGAYPARLAACSAPPTLLFVRGRLPHLTSTVTIVGSRRASPEGLEIAHSWAADFARSGVTVVSGLARGIDGAAHKGALAACGRTVAVLGCGADIVYPPEHKDLARRLLATGNGLVSQFWPGTTPAVGLFPARNATLAGLADAVVVVEAAADSGVKHTVAAAIREKRRLFVVPGPLSRDTSRGSNRLLQNGALPALDAGDVLRELSHEWITAPVSAPPGMEPQEQAIYDLLDLEGRQLDWLARQLRVEPPELVVRLLAMELRGIVVQLPGKRFARRGTIHMSSA